MNANDTKQTNIGRVEPRQLALRARLHPLAVDVVGANLRGFDLRRCCHAFLPEPLCSHFAEGFVEQADGLVDVGLADVERGREADDVAEEAALAD